MLFCTICHAFEYTYTRMISGGFIIEMYAYYRTHGQAPMAWATQERYAEVDPCPMPIQ